MAWLVGIVGAAEQRVNPPLDCTFVSIPHAWHCWGQDGIGCRER
jgi:hypothetical protein